MRSSSSAGLLLLLVAFIGIAGFLTRNLDRWLGALFTPAAGSTATQTSSASPTSIGATTARTTA